MIVAANRTALLPEFRELMTKTDLILNEDAKGNGDSYYADKNGTALEKIVVAALDKASVGTPFHKTIKWVSGAAFPDIVAAGYYGVEVKSTNKNHWQSTGSSILESTRIKKVERIFLTFGKLGAPVEFLSRPYEECLYDIAVTHYPRYRIDMRLGEGDTIFDKMGVSYDSLRSDPDTIVSKVAKYYKSRLQPGESLWWANPDKIEEEVTPAKVRLWNSVPTDEKNTLTACGYAFFPEILGNRNSTKFDRYTLWLAMAGIINSKVRDSFSAGGRVMLPTLSGALVSMPQTFSNIQRLSDSIVDIIYDTDVVVLMDRWDVKRIEDNRLDQWIKLSAASAATCPNMDYNTAFSVLSRIFRQ